MAAERDLEGLTGSVSDGGIIDWAKAAGDWNDPGERATFGALREVARIADFNRGLQRLPMPGTAETGVASDTSIVHWGPLALLEKVGSGTSGEVWRAWDPTLQREVALKFLSSGPPGSAAAPSGSRLLDEARALARVHHSGVVAVHGIAEHDGRTGMWMECLRGATLAAEIETRGAIAAREVARIGLELCHALEAVTSAGLVHGDLKPSNIVMEPGGRVVLTDFGLGRRRAVDDPESGRGSGTPIFMSPERLNGDPSTPSSDIYALGVTLRWALTGKPPFRARKLKDLLTEAEAGPSTPLATERPDAPRRLVAAIEKAMAPAAANRFANVSEMAAEMKSLPEAIDSPARNLNRRAWSMAAAAAAFFVAVAGALIVSRSLEEPDENVRGGTSPVQTSPGILADGAREVPVPPVTGSQAAAAPPSLTGAAAYHVEAALISRSGGVYHRLAPGDRVAPGDWLSLEFRASKPMWVYVLNEDDQGETYLLFPQPLFDQGNPVQSDSTMVLPGPVGGQENAWRVTSRGGREHFLVIASPEPVADIEAELERLPDARPGRPIQYAAIPPATVERLRGVGGVAELPEGAAGRGAGAFERFQLLAGRETVSEGVWVRKITLENPLQ